MTVLLRPPSGEAFVARLILQHLSTERIASFRYMDSDMHLDMVMDMDMDMDMGRGMNVIQLLFACVRIASIR